MKQKRLWRLLILSLVLLVIALALIGLDTTQPRAFAQIPPPLRVECGAPPDTMPGGWVLVNQFLAWSGCQSWECWSQWIYNDPSNALYELPGDRIQILNTGDPNPPGWPYPGNRNDPVPCPGCRVWDGRELCDGGQAAKGTWFHNVSAKPQWRTLRDPQNKWLIMMCEWVLDTNVHYWNFGENDRCQFEFCVEPTAAPGMTAPPTVCTIEETPIIRPTDPPPTPTPFVPNEPDVDALAYVRSTTLQADPNVWYQTDPDNPSFYWLWEHYLNAKLSARITEPSQPGCSVSSEVVYYYYLGSNDVEVCPNPNYGALVKFPPGGDAECVWRDPDTEEIHLLYSQDPAQPTQEASWNFYGLTPFNTPWTTIQYQVLVQSTYICNGYPYVVIWPRELTLSVGLLTPVRRR